MLEDQENKNLHTTKEAFKDLVDSLIFEAKRSVEYATSQGISLSKEDLELIQLAISAFNSFRAGCKPVYF